MGGSFGALGLRGGMGLGLIFLVDFDRPAGNGGRHVSITLAAYWSTWLLVRAMPLLRPPSPYVWKKATPSGG
jgi:hypothetical protein